MIGETNREKKKKNKLTNKQMLYTFSVLTGSNQLRRKIVPIQRILNVAIQ